MFLGAAFAPVLVGGQVPGSFGLLRPFAPAAELTAVTVVLALLRTRLQGRVPWLSLASDCEYAVKVPQLLARSTTNHVLTKVVRAEFEATSAATAATPATSSRTSLRILVARASYRTASC